MGAMILRAAASHSSRVHGTEAITPMRIASTTLLLLLVIAAPSVAAQVSFQPQTCVGTPPFAKAADGWQIKTPCATTTLTAAEAKAFADLVKPEPEPVWRPYADTSPFNTLVPSSPTISAKSRDVVANITSLGPARLVVDESREWDYSHPRYHAKATDPLYTLQITQSWIGNTNGHTIRIPDKARGAGWRSTTTPTDRHFAVVQPDGWEYDFHKVTQIGLGVIRANFGSRLRIDGAGRGGGSTVANFGLLAGMIRSEELIAGNIRHALFCTVRNSDGTNVYPALTQGSGSAAPLADRYKWPPLGARFQLAYTDAEIDNLPIPAYRKTIVRAMAEYGCYFGDTGGPGFALMLESPETYRSFGQQDPLVSWAASNNIPLDNGKYRLDVRTGVDWAGRLRLVAP